MLRSKRYGILTVVLITLLLRTLLISFTLYISSFRKNQIPSYYYNLHTVNLNSDYISSSYNRTYNKDNNNENNLNKNTKNKNIHRLKSKLYLKGKYVYPITTIYNFIHNFNRLNHPKDTSNQKNSNYSSDINTNKIDNKLNRKLKWLTGFASWDGERFLKNVIFRLSYTSEDSCAFFPLFPLFIYWLEGLIFLLLEKFFNINLLYTLTGVYIILLIGVVLNNLLSILNNVMLYLIITKLLEYNLLNNGYYKSIICNTNTSRTNNENYELYLRRIDKIGCLSSIVFNLSPGFIFTTSFYTEPSYSFFYYLIILLFFKLYTLNYKNTLSHTYIFTLDSNSNKDNNTNNTKHKHTNKSKSDSLLVLTAVGLSFISGFLRSNSILFAILLFFYKLYKCPLLNYIYNSLVDNNNSNHYNNTNNDNNSVSSSSNYKEKVVLNEGYNQNTNKQIKNVNILSLLLKFFCYWTLNLLYLFVILTPFLLIQLYGYLLFFNRLNFKLYSTSQNFVYFHHFVYYVLTNPKRIYDFLTKINGNYYNDGNFRITNNRKGNKKSLFSFMFPSIYKHIQNKYWGLKLFHSFRSWSNFVNFIYSFPILLILFMYLYNFTKYYILPNLTNQIKLDNKDHYKDKDINSSGTQDSLISNNYHSNHNKNKVVTSIKNLLINLFTTINNYEFGLFVHFFLTLNSFIFYSHIQIVFRQSLCLVQYPLQLSLMLFDLGMTIKNHLNKNKKLTNNNNTNNNKNYSNQDNITTVHENNKDNNEDKESKKLDIIITTSKLNKRFITSLFYFFLLSYSTILCFVGIILFSNFIGWT